jgi:hypothetical protein
MQPEALTRATVVGTLLQLAMVVGGHFSPQIANLFAVGGVAISAVAGVLYSVWARGGSGRSAAAGGAIAGAGSGLLGIIVSYLLGDVPASVLGLGTASSGVMGAIGALIGRALAGRRSP